MGFRNILAIKLRAMGDTVLFTSALQALQTCQPKAKIHVVTTDLWAPLLEGHPAVFKIWPYHRHQSKSARAKALALLAYKLRKETFDAVLNAHASPSSALLSFASGAPVRSIHFHGLKDTNRFSTVDIAGKGQVKPALIRDMDAVSALCGTQIIPPPTHIQVSETETQWARSWLDTKKIRGPVLSVSIGASRPSKRWDIDRFISVAHTWKIQTNGDVVFLLGPGETLGATEASKQWTCLEGASVRQLAALLSQTQVWLGNDSGPKHLAIALGIPTVTLMGPEDPMEWHPYDTNTNPYFYLPNLTCRNAAPPGFPPWCGIDVCTIEQHRCMKGIEPAAVAEACFKLLGRALK